MSLFQTWSSAYQVVSELHVRGWVEATYNVLERTRLHRAVGHVQSIVISPAVTFPSRVGESVTLERLPFEEIHFLKVLGDMLDY